MEKRVTNAASSPPSRAGAVFLYFTPLTLLVFLVLPNGFLLDIATSFMLKNQVRATPEQIANFRLVTAIPVYLSFFFGLARDLWNPFGLKDRGLLPRDLQPTQPALLRALRLRDPGGVR